MSRKLSIIIFILFLLLGGIFGFLYFSSGSGRSSELGDRSSTNTNGGFPTSQSVNGSSELVARSGGDSNSELRTPSSGEFLSGNTSILRQIVDVPVGGAMAYVDMRGQVTVRYIERETGHVQDQPIDEKVASKVTDTTVPKIVNAIFGKEGKLLVFQSLSGPQNLLLTVFAEIKKTVATTSVSANVALLGAPNLSTTVGELDGTVLPSSVHFVAISPDKTNYLYLNESVGGALGVIIPADKTKLAKSLTTVFSSKLTEWTSDWPSKNTVTFTTRAGSGLPGYMYSVNITTKQKTLLLKHIAGLTTKMSPDGARVLYGVGSGNGFATYLYDVRAGTEATFPLRTLPEKCVWSTKYATILYCAVPSYFAPGTYPDDWYMGVASFNDALWKINTATGETTQLLASATTLAVGQDITKLFFDDKEQDIFWINKADSTVWSVALPQ